MFSCEYSILKNICERLLLYAQETSTVLAISTLCRIVDTWSNPCYCWKNISYWSNYHHEIMFAKFNLKVFYVPPYEREVWHFNNATNDHIRKGLSDFSRGHPLSNDRDPAKISKAIKGDNSWKIDANNRYISNGKNSWLFKNFRLCKLNQIFRFKSRKAEAHSEPI